MVGDGLMTTKWAGWIVATLALAALAAGAVYAASHEAEVRITARQLEDGRVEFALQQRVDGEWGERQLPRSRFFPANVGHNRWLNSTPLTVSVEAEALEETSTGGSAISLSGTGSYADIIDTSAERYVCTFTVSGNTSRYGSTNVVVYIGGDLLVNEIEEAGTWRAIATPYDWSPEYGTVEVDVASAAVWQLSCD